MPVRSHSRNLGILHGKREHSYSSVPSGETKSPSGFSLQRLARLERLEVERDGVSESFGDNRTAGSGSIRQPNECTDGEIYELEAGSGGNSRGQLSDVMEDGQGIYVSPVLLDRQGVTEDLEGGSKYYVDSTG